MQQLFSLPDKVGKFFLLSGGRFNRRSFFHPEQPYHIFTQHAHNLPAFAILNDFAGSRAMDNVPVIGRGNDHFRIAEVMVQSVEGGRTARPSYRYNGCTHFMAQQITVGSGNKKQAVEETLYVPGCPNNITASR